MWRAFTGSQPGARHLRSGQESQDAVAIWPLNGVGDSILITVADGHGSATYRRSRKGAELAVKAAHEALRAFLPGSETQSSLEDPSTAKRLLEDMVPQHLTRIWEELVLQDLAANPLAQEDLAYVGQVAGVPARRRLEADPAVAYGSTVMAVLATEQFIACVQLGDGDIVIVGDDGVAARAFMPDARHFANETTSLVSPDSWSEVRTRFQRVVDNPPGLILVASDGYANSFRSEAEFLKAAPDILRLVRLNGPEALTTELDDWLKASADASGDDVTMGVLIRADLIGDQAEAAVVHTRGPESPLDCEASPESDLHPSAAPDSHAQDDREEATRELA